MSCEPLRRLHGVEWCVIDKFWVKLAELPLQRAGYEVVTRTRIGRGHAGSAEIEADGLLGGRLDLSHRRERMGRCYLTSKRPLQRLYDDALSRRRAAPAETRCA